VKAEDILWATVPVILGVIVAGYIMSAFGSSISLLGTAQQGYVGS